MKDFCVKVVGPAWLSRVVNGKQEIEVNHVEAETVDGAVDYVCRIFTLDRTKLTSISAFENPEEF